MADISEDLKNRMSKIKLLMLDVDGVLTDGRIVYGDYGDELKFFDVQDGFGLVTLRRAGIHTVFISAKKSRINRRRARELKVEKIFENVPDKKKVYDKLLKKFKLKDEEVCFIGDDWVDMPVLSRVGLAVAVPNAVPEIKQNVHYVTEREGGRGAVREVADHLLKARGLWERASEMYFQK